MQPKTWKWELQWTEGATGNTLQLLFNEEESKFLMPRESGGGRESRLNFFFSILSHSSLQANLFQRKQSWRKAATGVVKSQKTLKEGNHPLQSEELRSKLGMWNLHCFPPTSVVPQVVPNMRTVMWTVEQHGVNTASAIEPEDQNWKTKVHMRLQRERRSDSNPWNCLWDHVHKWI